MEISSRKARSQQNHLRLPLLPSPLPSSSAPLPLSSLADIFADDRLVYGQPLPSFPDLEQDISAQWDNGISHHRATDATTTGAVPTRSPPLLLDPSRGWPGTEVSIHLPPSLVIRDAIGHAELAFGQTRVPVRSDTFIDTRSRSSTDEVLRISAYAPSVSHPSSIPVNQQDSSSPSSLVEEKEGYTVEVTLHLLRSKYAVGTFTYLPVNFPIATSRPIAPPPLPCSMQSTSYKGIVYIKQLILPASSFLRFITFVRVFSFSANRTPGIILPNVLLFAAGTRP
ncbi:hypothetical protein BX666DRAFT_328043 [Dichotomocladium elegans]|nr:hypothetical protein BX666DRAFT_328043 [Dichotomocladium elegans]